MAAMKQALSGMLRRTPASILRPGLGARGVYTEKLAREELEQASSFYDSTIDRLMTIGREAMGDERKVLDYTKYAQRELPKRLARRLLDLRFLPYIVVTNPHIKKVYNSYYHAFHTLINWEEVKTPEQSKRYAALLQKLVDQHTPMLDALATGVQECRSRVLVGKQIKLDDFLDSMLRSRISRRVIAEHLIRLEEKRPGFIGCIRTNIDVKESVAYAARQTSMVCNEIFGEAVDVRISGSRLVSTAYVPRHLDYMLRELLKNAMRAVVEHHRNGHKPSTKVVGQLPPIDVKICEAEDEVTLRISDEGGGIPRHQLESVWEYGFTTLGQQSEHGAAKDLAGLFGSGSGGSTDSSRRLAGLGFGLPFSRLNARYFGGDLQLVNMPGHGTNVFLTLKRLRDQEWTESLEEDLGESIQAKQAVA